MPRLLFRLNGVPEDEANAVRALLAGGQFRTYETSAGFFGLGVAAIWLVDGEPFDQAKLAIDIYQEQRAAQARADYETALAQGRIPSFWQNLCQQPMRALGLGALMLFVLGLMLLPFWLLI